MFEKYAHMKFNEIRPMEAELFYADRRTDRHDEAYNHLSQFCEHD